MRRPCAPIETVRTSADAPCLIISATFVAASLPMIPDGMPVLGGDGAMTVPFADFRGCEIWRGGAKAIPTAKMLGKRVPDTCSANPPPATPRTA
jgi:hypothetical protein